MLRHDNGACRPVAVAEAATLVLCHIVKYLQVIWRSGIRRWNLRVLDLHMNCTGIDDTLKM